MGKRKIDKKKVKKVAKGGAGAALVGGVGYAGYKMVSDSTNGSGSSSNSGNSSSTSPSPSGSGSTEDSSGSGSGSGSSSSGGSGDSEYESKVVEVPITNYKDALAFANREWNKIKRDNGRQLDVEVLGSCKWKCGEWCKVYLPKFDIDGYMYIIRVSQSSDGGDWTTNLSLVDYPPGWGKEELKDDSSDSEEDSDSGSDDSGSGSGSDSSSSGSNSGSNNSNNKTEAPKTKDINGKTYYIYGDKGTDSDINSKKYYNTG